MHDAVQRPQRVRDPAGRDPGDAIRRSAHPLQRERRSGDVRQQPQRRVEQRDERHQHQDHREERQEEDAHPAVEERDRPRAVAVWLRARQTPDRGLQHFLAEVVRVSGATVHFVDERYDEGAIIAQWPVPVLPGDTPESLAARVLGVEHRILPLAVEALARDSAPAAMFAHLDAPPPSVTEPTMKPLRFTAADALETGTIEASAEALHGWLDQLEQRVG